MHIAFILLYGLLNHSPLNADILNSLRGYKKSFTQSLKTINGKMIDTFYGLHNNQCFCMTNEVPEEVIQLVHEIAREKGINPSTLRIRNTSMPYIHAFFNQICINVTWFMQLSLKQKRGILKHELGHIRRKDSRKMLLLSLTLSIALNYYLAVQRDLFERKLYREQFNDQKKYSRTLIFINLKYMLCNLAAALGNISVITAYSRAIEKKADLDLSSYEMPLEDIEGLIEFLKNEPDQIEKALNNMGVNTAENAPLHHRFFSFFVNTCLRTHPHNTERIRYLEHAITAKGSSAT